MNSVLTQSVTVTDRQIMDLLLSQDWKDSALIIGVGGSFVRVRRTLAVPFEAVKHTVKDGMAYLTLDTTKDALKAAPGLKYDRNTTTWVPESK